MVGLGLHGLRGEGAPDPQRGALCACQALVLVAVMRQDDAIAFGEKVLALLDQGAFTATYKYAVLLALIDVCLERSDVDGRPPRVVWPHDLAARVVELYWPQARLYGTTAQDAVVLRQSSSGQAEIVTLVRRFKERSGREVTLHRARLADPSAYDKLVADVGWKLVEMPLPRLQRFGSGEPFLYDIGWELGVKRSDYLVRPQEFGIQLRQDVGNHLVRLAGLLRPLLQQQWAERIVRWNRSDVPELAARSDLDAFLFGADRTDLAPVRRELRRLPRSPLPVLRCGAPRTGARGSLPALGALPR
jgi:hypothetical protein